MKWYLQNIKYLLQPIPELEPCTHEDYINEVALLKVTVSDLISRNEELLEAMTSEEHPRKRYYDEKYDESIIKYDGRALPYTNERIKVDVRTFITPYDLTVRKWCHLRQGLKCLNPLKYDDKVRDFYLADREDFKYRYDHESTNNETQEVWLLPFELTGQGFGDCEDHAHRMKSRLNCLGLPDWRSRIVCGTTRSGYGHSTVYYLADDLKTWVHLNSTTPGNQVSRTLPTKDDDKDGPGVSIPWFSFNKEKSWSDFSKPEAGKTKRFENISIQ